MSTEFGHDRDPHFLLRVYTLVRQYVLKKIRAISSSKIINFMTCELIIVDNEN